MSAADAMMNGSGLVFGGGWWYPAASHTWLCWLLAARRLIRWRFLVAGLGLAPKTGLLLTSH